MLGAPLEGTFFVLEVIDFLDFMVFLAVEEAGFFAAFANLLGHVF